jgi:DNA polymerase/3'-5' exonuclease PolX
LETEKGERMKLEEAKKIADEFINPFQTLFYKIEIVGSIRRGKSEVKDIDLNIRKW